MPLKTCKSGTLTPNVPLQVDIDSYSDGISITNLTPDDGLLWVSFRSDTVPAPYADNCYPVVGSHAMPSINGLTRLWIMSQVAAGWSVAARPETLP